MDLIFDVILILLSSLFVFSSYNKVIYKPNCSSANYIIILIYIFCVIPIIMNYIIGIPKYDTIYWYKVFIEPMHNENVNIIYDIYILMSITFLYIIAIKNSNMKSLDEYNTVTYIINKSLFLKLVMYFLPIIYIIITGSWKYYTVYAVASMRGMSEINGLNLLTPCMLLSMVIFFSYQVKNKITFKNILNILIYSAIIVWLSGKRFMLANITFIFVFYLVNLDLNRSKRNFLYKFIPILSIFLIFFSVFYLIFIRPMSETTWISLYDMLRVDFGRDDVIKFVINREFIEENPILDYYGQTFIGLLGSFIPRAIWESKPYPHYMYLTSAILNLDIHNLPAGTTPSILEMVICNFSYLGFFIGIASLIYICNFIDKLHDKDSKAIGLLLTLAIITQSMDVYLILVALFIGIYFIILLKKNKYISLKIKM